MSKKFTKLFFLILIVLFGLKLQAQTVITQWNFNSKPPDASTSTGSINPSKGTGILTALLTTTSYSSGSGSSDTTTIDNTGLGLTGWQTQGNGNKTAGIQLAVSTIGNSNINLKFDLRHSNTGPRHFTVQYTTNISATTPIWIDFADDSTTAGDLFVNNRSYNFSVITALNNNANAGFRIVAAFRPTTSTYVAATSTSSFATTGTWRFDMLTIQTAPANATVSFVGTKTSVNETTSSVNIIANLQDAISTSSSVDIEILPISTATSGSDFILPASLKFEWSPGQNLVNDTITININNDIISENAEYFIVRFINPVNITLPSSSTNNYTVMIVDNDRVAPIASQSITLNHIASFSNGTSGTNSAEIVAHDPISQRLFIANSIAGKIDIVNFKNPAAASLITSIPLTDTYGNINSIAVKNGIVAAAIENIIPEQPGKVVFFDTTGVFINQVIVGAMPDMITFTNDGTKVLTANEGQPNAAYTVDPEGSISIINISGGIASLTQTNVTTATFTSYNSQANSLKASGIRIYGLNNATVAKDMEPEYISFSADNNTAYVTCQENNAIAVVDIPTSTITALRPLGTKNHLLSNNSFDISDVGTSIEMANWPVKGLYMPDAIASYTANGQLYYVTANEGDSREYTAYVEPARISSTTYILDSLKFPYRDALKANLGRLNVTLASGDTDGDGDYDEIHAFGARSFSIWNATSGALVWDSGDALELITSKHPTLSALFNASNANNTLKNRSDDKGPEPEGITIAQLYNKTFAFIALERIGGCMVYDITDPLNPIYVDYKNTRNLASYGGDNGAEGIIFINAANSPTGDNIIILANEVSSTLTFYKVDITTLEINLSEINAKNDGNKNVIFWKTVSESKNDAFELQKSKDGINFTTIGSINANGFPSTYSFDDLQPHNGLSYYRIKMKNNAIDFSYSKIVTAYLKNNRLKIKLSPNPFNENLTISTSELPSSNSMIEIYDTKGVLVKSMKIISQNTSINLSSLSTGNYLIKYIENNQVQTQVISKL